jgi:hypothetical protein
VVEPFVELNVGLQAGDVAVKKPFERKILCRKYDSISKAEVKTLALPAGLALASGEDWCWRSMVEERGVPTCEMYSVDEN